MRIAILSSAAVCLLAAACTSDPLAPPSDVVADSATAAATVTGYVLAAGDIASCRNDGDSRTARLLDRYSGTVLALGDNAYDSGTTAEYTDCYHPTWGRHRSRTRPSIGNHDYKTSRGAPYYAYFGWRAGPSGRGYYSFNFGGWHVIALNSNIDVSSSSTQVQWLRSDLAANPARCTLAFFHHPRFSSGYHGTSSRMRPIWDVLYAANADLVLNGHDHDYERFAPQTPAGAYDSGRGIIEIVVGTGGVGLRSFSTIRANSVYRSSRYLGVLRVALTATGFSWKFIDTGDVVRDQGSRSCH